MSHFGSSSGKVHWILVVAILLILVGGFMANRTQTDRGNVVIRDVRFMGSNGILMSGLLYVPKGVDAKNKAPGILAVHGYINSRETQDGFAIEFARRGYVVLAIDQTGHGYSDPPAYANGFGGIDGLKYLRSLDMVDIDNIGLEGHSMGGWAIGIAASVIKDGYKSCVFASSSTGTYGCPEGTPTYPRNMGLIFSKYDEFSGLMWKSPVPGNIVKTDKLKKVFDTQEDVVVGKLYGSIEEGTARKLYQPSMIHPRVHLSTEAIGNAVEWFQMTLKGGNNRPPSDQTWYWKEIFNLVALVGMVFLLFGVGWHLLRTKFFGELNETPSEPKSVSGVGWWVGAVITILLPIPLYVLAWSFYGKGIAKASCLWPQQITTTLMFWAVAVGVVSLVLFLLWHFISNRKKGGTVINYGFAWKEKGWRKIGKSFLFAAVVIFWACISLAFSDWAFKTDFRFWVFAVKPMSLFHFKVFLGYFIPFAFYFLMAGLVLHGELRPNFSGWKEMVVNVLLMIGGYILFLLFQYIPLFAGKTLSIPEGHLFSIVMFQFLPIFTMVALVSTYYFRKTGHIFVGSFINAMLITWIVVAGQATHFKF
jgi:pimeloyl-ACP methyl ester carboxylesterase